MDWIDILRKARSIKEEFNKSYKCLNTDRPTKDETVKKHIEILLKRLEQIRVLLNVNYNRLTPAHKVAAEAFFQDIRNKLLQTIERKGIKISIPPTLHEKIEIQQLFVEPTYNNHTTMAQTPIDFLNTAAKLIPDFDGKPDNLRSFLDSLQLLDSIKGNHEALAINLIKTKLKGNARNLINNENTITEILNKLKTSVKGESVEVLTAKIMNIKQNNKTANVYCNEIETLTKSLETAYISDGLPTDIASKYSTQTAIKALTKNCTIDKVKLIMEAGQFNSMNEAISKFVNSCTEATGQQNAILYFKQKPNAKHYNRNFIQSRGRPNYPRNVNRFHLNNNNNTNNNNNYNNRNGQRQNNNRGSRTRNYVRATEAIQSENLEEPLRLNQ